MGVLGGAVTEGHYDRSLAPSAWKTVPVNSSRRVWCDSARLIPTVGFIEVAAVPFDKGQALYFKRSGPMMFLRLLADSYAGHADTRPTAHSPYLALALVTVRLVTCMPRAFGPRT